VLNSPATMSGCWRGTVPEEKRGGGEEYRDLQRSVGKKGILSKEKREERSRDQEVENGQPWRRLRPNRSNYSLPRGDGCIEEERERMTWYGE